MTFTLQQAKDETIALSKFYRERELNNTADYFDFILSLIEDAIRAEEILHEAVQMDDYNESDRLG